MNLKNLFVVMALFNYCYSNTGSCMDANNNAFNKYDLLNKKPLYSNTNNDTDHRRNNYGTKYFKYERQNKQNKMNYNTGMNNIEKYNAAQYNEVIMDLDDEGYQNPVFKVMYNTKDNKVRLEDIKNRNYRERNIGVESYNKRYYNDVFKRKSRSLPNKDKSQQYKNMLDDISNDYEIGNNNVNNNNIINDNQEYIENVNNEYQNDDYQVEPQIEYQIVGNQEYLDIIPEENNSISANQENSNNMNVSNEHQAGYQTEYQDDEYQVEHQDEYQDDVSDNISNDADEEDERDDNQEHIEAIDIGNDYDNYLLL